MFKKWFTPKWMSEKVEVRVSAVARLSPEKPADKEILLKMAREDQSFDVRKAAALKLNSLELTFIALSQATQTQDQASLVGSVIELLSHSTKPAAAVFDSLERILSDDVLAMLCLRASDEHLALQACSQISDMARVEQIACEHSLLKVRVSCIERLTDTEQLKRVLVSAKGKDKTLYRTAKAKLDVQKQELKVTEQYRIEVKSVLQALGHLANSDDDLLLPHKFAELQSRWNDIASDCSEFDKAPWESEYQAYCDQICAKILALSDAERQAAAAAVKAEQAEAAFEQVCQMLEEALESAANVRDYSTIDLALLEGVVESQKVRWEKAAVLKSPRSLESRRYKDVTRQVASYQKCVSACVAQQKQIAKWLEESQSLKAVQIPEIKRTQRSISDFLKQCEWPTGVDELLVYGQLRESLLALENLLGQSAQAIETQKTNIEKMLESGEQAVASGDIKQGQVAFKKAQELIQVLPKKTADLFAARLQSFGVSLTELTDWKAYALGPKKQALVDKMQALITADIPALDRADRIKEMQQQWKALGNVQSGEDRSLWNAFKAASDEAYQPCKAYYDEQRGKRSENLSKRYALIDQLSLYESQYNWGQADWAMVVKTLRAAREEWRQYAPVERSDHTESVAKFESAMKAIQVHLDEERELNAKRKQTLIDQADALLALESLDDAISGMKGLQAKWKKIGIVDRKVDQTLWSAFREKADAVFAKRQQLEADQETLLQENQQKIVELTQQVQQWLGLTSQELLAAAVGLDKVVSEFESISPLPKEKARELRDGFFFNVDSIKAAVSDAKVAAHEQSFDRLWQAAKLLDQIEEHLVVSTLTQESVAGFKEAWQGFQPLPASSLPLLNARFDQVVGLFAAGEPLQSIDINAFQQKLRNLTISMEILAGVGSAAEDQQLRMELQVSRLSGRLSGSDTVSSQQISSERESVRRSALSQSHELQIEWCAIATLSQEGQRQQLLQSRENYADRFFRALNHIKDPNAELLSVEAIA